MYTRPCGCNSSLPLPLGDDGAVTERELARGVVGKAREPPLNLLDRRRGRRREGRVAGDRHADERHEALRGLAPAASVVAMGDVIASLDDRGQRQDELMARRG